jgi:hypothetical protein
LPVVHQQALQFGDEVAFIAVAWKGTLDDTRSQAEELFPTDSVRWALDEEEAVFDLYGVTGQPATFLVSSGVIVDRWFGPRDENSIQESIRALLAIGA